MKNAQNIIHSISEFSTAEINNDLRFNDIFDLEHIQLLQDRFSDATGVASIITYPDGLPITRPSNFCRLCKDIIRKTEKGLSNCYLSDAALGSRNSSGPVVLPCLSGELWDAGVDITVGGKHIANWLIGQVRNEELDDERIVRYAEEIGADKEDFIKALAEVPMMSMKQFIKVSDMLYTLANELSISAFNNLQLKMQIAAQKEAEEKILMLAHAVRSVGECVSITDMDERIVFVNRAFLKTYQYEEHELLGQPISFVRSPGNSLSDVADILPATLRGGWHGELLNQRKDGSEFPVFVSSSIIHNESGEPIALIGITTDITAQKQAQEQIKQTETHFQALIENAPDGIVLVDIQGKFKYASPSSYTMFGYLNQSFHDLSPNDLTHPDDLPAVLKLLNEIMVNPVRILTLEYRFRHQNGSWIWIESTFKNLLMEPSVGAIVINFRNISERKIAENQIRELNQELDQRVKQRTSELEEVNRELETFSYSVSHDLKAPLRHIRGFIDLIMNNQSTELTEEKIGYLQRISSSAFEMAQLIDALLSFSRLNQAELRKSRIQSAPMVQKVIKFFEPELQNRSITFQIESLPDVYGDEELIRQVWTNLISNAIKYTGKKPEALIHIGSASNGNETTFFIKDNGAGFPMKYTEKLFGVFQRLHKTRDFEGVGIGLANVKRIIGRHGGRCGAEGEQEVGATFYFSLPNMSHPLAPAPKREGEFPLLQGEG